MSDIPVCIDISHWQDFPNFAEVAASGVRGVIHKATEGTSYTDPNRARNCTNAVMAGLAISTYFWIKPGDGRAQAEFYLETIDPVQGERCVIDYEEAGCSLTTLIDAVQALIDYKNDLQITVYSGHLIKEQLSSRNDFLAKNTDLWLAQYTSNESSISWETATWPQWALWQYSETGTVPGIDGALVDLNNFNGSEADFLTWINPKGQPPVPLPLPETTLVSVAISAPEGVTVSVTVNGMLAQRKRNFAQKLMKRGPDL